MNENVALTTLWLCYAPIIWELSISNNANLAGIFKAPKDLTNISGRL